MVQLTSGNPPFPRTIVDKWSSFSIYAREVSRHTMVVSGSEFCSASPSSHPLVGRETEKLGLQTSSAAFSTNLKERLFLILGRGL